MLGNERIKSFFENYGDKNVKLSVSATTRDKRAGEIDKINYYFLTKEEFKEKINNNEFYEYERNK